METEPATTQYESGEKDSQAGNTSQEEKNRGNVPISSPSTRAQDRFLKAPSLGILGGAIMALVLLAIAWKDDSAVVRISVIVTVLLCLVLVGGAILMMQRLIDASSGL
ncbi:hypothetical protein P692DRAFT_20826430 [Suillus brevipes Sb2]|nr:hypothetical protein P692DRAFT_20826430 [Suillus brevipes Sb2]